MSHSWREGWGPSKQQQQLLRIILQASQSEAIKWSTLQKCSKEMTSAQLLLPSWNANKNEQENGEDYE
jgi:hypothetical protein